ncbi:MAG: molecular chaperone HtpG [Planctomycetota bacterium]|nr:MAG: molecular chaperone HtpG [Planctomycetota bacterium]
MADPNAPTAEPEAVESHEFQADTKALLDLMINSLYTHREVFLRELISNASDALDKLRLRSLTEHDILGDDKEFEIVLEPDDEAGTLTISDNGIGMTADELRAHLGTIARSGSRELAEQLKEVNKKGGGDADAFIGRFGVGFYSAFLVADRVTVVSRAAGQEDAWRWESTGEGSYTIAPAERARRGTDVILHLREDQREYLSTFTLRRLIQKYSDFVGHPIKLVEEKTEGEGDEQKKVRSQEVVNQGQALWTRPRSEISKEQYEEFYKHVSHDWEAPLAWTHFTIEGTQLFTGLLFVPRRAPFDLFLPERRSGVRLYVKRVFVMEECDALLPEYLRFVRGVVDSDDLPLNVSREVLQHDRVVEQIRKQVTRKTLELLAELAEERPDDYVTFWEAFGRVLKEGLHTDPANKDRLAKLLRYKSTSQEKWTSLADYVARMPEGQEHIYYISGPSEDFLSKSPHIEGLKAKGYEVLYFVDPVDEWVAMALPEFEGKKLVSATKGELKLEGETAEEAKDEGDELTKTVAEVLGERVAAVRYTDRLTDSPVCLVSGEHDPGANLERILKAAGGGLGPGLGGKRTLELNRSHPLVDRLRRMAGDPAQRERLADWTRLLYDQALLTEGSPIEDPADFARRMNALLLEVGHGADEEPSGTADPDASTDSDEAAADTSTADESPAPAAGEAASSGPEEASSA